MECAKSLGFESATSQLGVQHSNPSTTSALFVLLNVTGKQNNTKMLLQKFPFFHDKEWKEVRYGREVKMGGGGYC